MNHPLNIPDLIIGGMLMLSSAFALIFTCKRREIVRGLSYKQFARCCAVGIVGGAIIAAWQLILGP
jgi:hypothetical protein